jgi:ABC-type lipoprotein release transport system permease subunit
MAGAGATLTLVALTASAVPAYRAVRLDPVKVLRAE